jgi:O-methyltransferase involved in polyketide biosynthesis
MQPALPSRSALRVALRRAAHQIYDPPPLVFPDPLAVRILGGERGEHAEALRKTATKLHKPHSVALRAFLVARSRYAEDTLASLAQALPRPVTQYVLLGAGLDTFAHRNPHPNLRVFELDHPATQAWKQELLARAHLPTPASLTFVPIDLEHHTPTPTPAHHPTSDPCDPAHDPSPSPTNDPNQGPPQSPPQSLAQSLLAAGFDPASPTFFAWLGVVPYLTLSAFRATLAFIAAQPKGSGVVFDYCQPRAVLPPLEQLARDSMSSRLLQTGEPFQLFFTPEEAALELSSPTAFSQIEDLGTPELNARYFPHPTRTAQPHLHLRGSSARLLTARL